MAEFLIAVLNERGGGKGLDFVEGFEKGGAKRGGGGVVIVLGAAYGFGDNAVDEAEFEEIRGGEAEGGGGAGRLAGVAVDDGGAAFGGDNAVISVLQHIDAIGDAEAERAAAAAFADHSGQDRNAEARHLAQVDGDGFGLAALLGVDAGIRAGGVEEGDNGPVEFGGEAHDAKSLAVSLRLGHAEVAVEFLLGVAAFLLADNDDGA